MRKLLLGLMLFTASAFAQFSSVGIQFVKANPSGACATQSTPQLNISVNPPTLWACQSVNNTWVAIGGGSGGSGTVGSGAQFAVGTYAGAGTTTTISGATALNWNGTKFTAGITLASASTHVNNAEFFYNGTLTAAAIPNSSVYVNTGNCADAMQEVLFNSYRGFSSVICPPNGSIQGSWDAVAGVALSTDVGIIGGYFAALEGANGLDTFGINPVAINCTAVFGTRTCYAPDLMVTNESDMFFETPSSGTANNLLNTWVTCNGCALQPSGSFQGVSVAKYNGHDIHGAFGFKQSVVCVDGSATTDCLYLGAQVSNDSGTITTTNSGTTNNFTVAGGTVKLDAPGDTMYVAGSTPGCPSNICTIATVITDTTGTFTTGPNNQAGVNWNMSAQSQSLTFHALGSAGASYIGQIYVAQSGKMTYVAPSGMPDNWFIGGQFGMSMSYTSPNTFLAVGQDGVSTNGGAIQIANASAAAHTLLVSAATTTNNIRFFTVTPTTGDLIDCVGASPTCTLTDSGVLASSVATTLTTTGSSGAATLTGHTLNVPIYTGAGSLGFNNITTGSNTTATMTCGTGCTVTFAGTGSISANNIGSGIALASGLLTIDTTFAPSNTIIQNNTLKFLHSTSGNATYAAAPAGQALAGYSNGQAFLLVADTTCSGAASLNISTLGQLTLTQIDGTTACNDSVVANVPTWVYYDGVNNIFRTLMSQFQTNGTSNGSALGVNFITSATNSIGLVATPVNSGLTEKLEISGAVITSGIAANAVTSAKLAVANTYGKCDFAFGDTSSASVLVNGQLGPQVGVCFVPAASTVVEVDVRADAGTPNIIVGGELAGTVSNFTSSALATAAAGARACSNTGGTTGIDGSTTCSGTLQNTSIAAGTYLQAVSGTAGGTAKWMTAHVIYKIN